MKKGCKVFSFLKPVLIISVLFFTAFQSNGQQSKPTDSGYATVNGSKVYYEVYGKGSPIVLLHGAFMTISGTGGN